jgi:xylulokinase
LPADTAVVVGGQDQCCAALGMGATSPGQVMLASGTAWVITVLTGKMRVDQAPAQVDLNYHVVPEVHTVSQLLGPFGAMVEWWLNEACPSCQSAQATTRAARYAVLDRILAGSVPGARDLLFMSLGGSSQLGGRTARGGFVGLRLDQTHADMARALLEGAAFEVRWALETMAQSGLSADGMWVSGGATRSPFWPEIVASVTGVPLRLARGANWPARGAGLLAAAGAGLASDMVEAAARWALPMTTVTPDASLRELYAARYAVYREVTQALAGGRP